MLINKRSQLFRTEKILCKALFNSKTDFSISNDKRLQIGFPPNPQTRIAQAHSTFYIIRLHAHFRNSTNAKVALLNGATGRDVRTVGSSDVSCSMIAFMVIPTSKGN